MNKVLLSFFLLLLFSVLSISQVKIDEGFESSDSLNLPAGWTNYNNAAFPIDPWSNWTVRDSGLGMVGLSTATSRSHSGLKSCGATWNCAIDTINNTTTNGDSWLVTKRINVTAGDSLIFWATGGTTNFSDSLQIWVGVDSLPPDFTDKIGRIFWPTGTTYGQYQRYRYSLSAFAGQTIWIGFRYCSDGTGSSGFAIQIDDIFVGVPVGIHPISTEVPKAYNLRQNYPNPFNPVTNIEFSIPKGSFVSMIIYNELGQQIRELVGQDMKPGTYKVDFNASELPSGAYFYRLVAGDYVKTNKMILTK